MLTLILNNLRAASKTASISTTTNHTKTKPIDRHTKKTIRPAHCQFRSPAQKKVTFDPKTKKRSQIRSLPRKASFFRRYYCNQVNSDLYTEFELSIDPNYKTSQFGMLPDTKTKLI